MPCCQQLFDCRCRWWWCWCWWCCRCRCGSCCFPEVRCEPNKIHIFINIMSMDHMDLQTNHIYRSKQGMACQDHLFIDVFFLALPSAWRSQESFERSIWTFGSRVNGLLDLNETKVKNTPFTFVAVGIVESPLWPLDVWEVMGSCRTTILTTHMWKKPERASDFWHSTTSQRFFGQEDYTAKFVDVLTQK